ncbi:DNA uptake protein ComE-like DNA-binding protein [Flavobacterium sp. AG291]|nr:DNA uptake protein ComE-like DNA-binding protein [Flavobacterium sp. AG291]
MVLFGLIIVFQIIYFILTSFDFASERKKSNEQNEWLAHQDEINALKEKTTTKDTIYPFNPNFITDYKGYILGLSTSQLDKLHAYRASGRFINSVSDFKQITGVHDTLLLKLEPYFKFGNKPLYYNNNTSSVKEYSRSRFASDSKAVKVIDINEAIEEDLIKVYGIGPYYAKEILKRRSVLGGFVSMDQMDDFSTLSAEAKSELKKYFSVSKIPEIEKINVNTASLLQLSRFPYFNKDIARSVITQRSMDGKIRKIDDLLEIQNFPVDKVKIIALYLEF